LQVTAGSAGIPESLLDDVRSVPGVRVAVPVIEAVVYTTDAGQGNISILGVDMTGDRSMRDYEMEGNEGIVSDPLVFLVQPDSLIVSKEFAARNNLVEDSEVNLVTALGSKRFTVRGIMTSKGMAKAFGGFADRGRSSGSRRRARRPGSCTTERKVPGIVSGRE
jgi:putative ABC transport system permease protein